MLRWGILSCYCHYHSSRVVPVPIASNHYLEVSALPDGRPFLQYVPKGRRQDITTRWRLRLPNRYNNYQIVVLGKALPCCCTAFELTKLFNFTAISRKDVRRVKAGMKLPFLHSETILNPVLVRASAKLSSCFLHMEKQPYHFIVLDKKCLQWTCRHCSLQWIHPHGLG